MFPCLILAVFPICYTFNGVRQFWSELLIRSPLLKYCSVLVSDPNDKDIIKAILSDHVAYYYYFHTQEQMFVAAKISTSQVEEKKEEDVKK